MKTARILLVAATFACGCSGDNASGQDGGGDGGGGTGGQDLSANTDGAIDMLVPPTIGDSVLQHHRNQTRDGLYVQPALTKTAAAGLHALAGFSATISGPTYAQSLFVDGMGAGPDMLIVATEQNKLYALNPTTGAVIWQQTLDPPLPLATIMNNVGNGCGNISPVGITGTPVIDLPSRTMYFDLHTPDATNISKHLIYAVSNDDGSTRTGWPVDVAAKVGGFTSILQQQRPAVALVGGRIYVSYGGHIGDCGNYHGWVVSVNASDPTDVTSWSSRPVATGIWGVGGPASDGTSIFITTGNTTAAPPSTWQDTEAIIKLGAGATFSQATTDYFSPSDWMTLDLQDIDLGGSGPVVFDVPGATPSKLVFAFGKDGKVYAVDRTSLGGVDAQVAELQATSTELIQAAAAYTTPSGSYLVMMGNGVGCPTGGGNLTAVKITTTPTLSMAVAWCSDQGGGGSPMVTTTDGTNEAIVWALGSDGDNRLHGFDGDTGAVIFDGGAATFSPSRRFNTPIAAKGRIYWAADGAVYAFTP